MQSSYQFRPWRTFRKERWTQKRSGGERNHITHNLTTLYKQSSHVPSRSFLWTFYSYSYGFYSCILLSPPPAHTTPPLVSGFLQNIIFFSFEINFNFWNRNKTNMKYHQRASRGKCHEKGAPWSTRRKRCLSILSWTSSRIWNATAFIPELGHHFKLLFA